MDYETITLEQNDGVAVLTLNRPDKMNALTAQMRAEIGYALRAAAATVSRRLWTERDREETVWGAVGADRLVSILSGSGTMWNDGISLTMKTLTQWYDGSGRDCCNNSRRINGNLGDIMRRTT